MKTTEIKKYLCIGMATVSALCSVACGTQNAPVAQTAEASALSVAAVLPAEPTPVITEVPTITTAAEPAAQNVTRAIEGTAVDRFPDADIIEEIAAGRYVVITEDTQYSRCSVQVYDISTDTVLNDFYVYNLHYNNMEPIIFEGRGFGFVTKGRVYDNTGLYAYYYDTEGNVVNEFHKDLKYYNYSYALAPDGSALYVAENDREQCACGYDFKADYTTQIYAVYDKDNYELIAEYDSHTDLYLLGTTSDGKLIVNYHYDPNEKVILTHEQYEIQGSLAAQTGSTDPGIEDGIELIDIAGNQTPKMIFQADTFYSHVFVRGDKIIQASDERMVWLCPDENGNYFVYRYDTVIGRKNIYTDFYVSVDGNYAVYPTYNDDETDTTVNIVYFDGDQITPVFSKLYPDCRIRFSNFEFVSMLDAETGDFYGRCDETFEGGQIGLTFKSNMYQSN